MDALISTTPLRAIPADTCIISARHPSCPISSRCEFAALDVAAEVGEVMTHSASLGKLCFPFLRSINNGAFSVLLIIVCKNLECLHKSIDASVYQ